MPLNKETKPNQTTPVSCLHKFQWSNNSISNISIYHESFVCSKFESHIWPTNRTQSGTNTLGKSGPKSESNEGIFLIPQTSSITGDSLSDCSMSYAGESLWRGVLTFAEMLSVYFTASSVLACIECVWWS